MQHNASDALFPGGQIKRGPGTKTLPVQDYVLPLHPPAKQPCKDCVHIRYCVGY